jgi:hypothetical protein
MTMHCHHPLEFRRQGIHMDLQFSNEHQRTFRPGDELAEVKYLAAVFSKYFGFQELINGIPCVTARDAAFRKFGSNTFLVIQVIQGAEDMNVDPVFQ